METSPAVSLPLVMLAVFASCKLLSELAERAGVPGIVGEILAGVFIGPSLLNWVAPNETLTALSELGVIFLLFRVGMEVKSSELLRVGPTASLVALIGVVVPMALGWGLGMAWGRQQVESLFIGAALVATSVGITAQVLSAKGVLSQTASQIILAAAVIDDVLGLIVLAVVSGSKSGRFHWMDLAVAGLPPLIFAFMIARWGTHVMRQAVPVLDSRLRATESQFHLAMVLLFALSVMAMYTGVAAIVGAFLAGMALGESVGQRVHDLVHGTSELLTPFFLGGIGLHISLSTFRNSSMVWLFVVMLAIACISKVVGCGLGAASLGWKDAMKIGVGMMPRGEVGMVVAQLGLTLGALSKEIYGVVVLVCLATTVVAPPLLNLVYRESGDVAAEEAVVCR